MLGAPTTALLGKILFAIKPQDILANRANKDYLSGKFGWFTPHLGLPHLPYAPLGVAFPWQLARPPTKSDCKAGASIAAGPPVIIWRRVPTDLVLLTIC